MKLLYICRWDPNKKKSWSGTTYSLEKALAKKTQIEEVDMTFSRLQYLLLSVLNIRLSIGGLKINNNCRRLTIIINQWKLKRKCSKYKENPKLFIEDFGIESNQYIYTDLTIEAVLFLRQNFPELSKYLNFRSVPLKALLIKNKYQLNIIWNSKGLFTMSSWLAQFLIEQMHYPAEKIHVVGGGINLDIKNIQNGQKLGNKILFVGRDFYRKGGDLVLEAFNILKTKYFENAELYIVGPKVNPSGYQKGVTFLGDLPTEELYKVYNICDIFCMPSRFEAYGIVFAEALVYGLPCIGRNAFEMKKFIREGINGYLIDDDNAEYLAGRMGELLVNTKIKSYVINNRDFYIKEYSWDNVASKILRTISGNKSMSYGPNN